MTKYSHTQLSTFRTCRRQYKFKYIDREKGGSRSVETYMGSAVHEVLEALYNNLKFGITDSKEQLLELFDEKWESGMSETPKVAKEGRTLEDYRSLGRKCVSDYYDSHYPFDQMKVLGVETDDVLELPDGNTFYVRIDKLGCIGNEYYVCDYKTNGRMKTQQEADEDRQLAVYSAWVRKAFPDAEKVHLLWHMLVFDKDVVSERTQEQIDALLDDIVSEIKEIETCTEFPENPSYLCDYCDYRDRCPQFVHIGALEDKTPEEFSEDDGVKLVDSLQELETKKKELQSQTKTLDAEIDAVKASIADFAESFGASVVYGTEYQSAVKHDVSYSYKDTKDEVIRLMKEKGLFSEYESINDSAVRSAMKKGTMDPEITALAVRTETVSVGFAKRKKEKEEK